MFWFLLRCLALLRPCWREGICYILVCKVIRLEVLGELLVLVVRIIVRVFLQMYMDGLEKKCVWMIAGYLFDYLLVFLEDLGTLLVGIDVGSVDYQFLKNIYKNYL